MIYYGAGAYAEANIAQWLSAGCVPACFADADSNKHYSFVDAPTGEKFKILPLHEALDLYPEADIALSVSRTSYTSVVDDLYSRGIPHSRMSDPMGSKGSASHCKLIGRYFNYTGVSFATCCEPMREVLASVGDIEEDIAHYRLYCEQLNARLRDGILTSCAGCYRLETGADEDELAIDSICLSTGLLGGDSCNFKCSYCDFANNDWVDCNKGDRPDVLSLIKYISDKMSIKRLDYASGEITVSEYRDEIFRIWKKMHWKGYILTNAAVYSKGIDELLRSGLVKVNISLDAGNAATFVKVKGVDCYQKVVRNVERYAQSAQAGQIQLKFIVIEGVNDNPENIDSFVELARKCNAEVVISLLFRASSESHTTQSSANVYSAVKRLAKASAQEGVDFSLKLNSIFPNDFDSWEKEGLLIEHDDYRPF